MSCEKASVSSPRLDMLRTCQDVLKFSPIGQMKIPGFDQQNNQSWVDLKLIATTLAPTFLTCSLLSLIFFSQPGKTDIICHNFELEYWALSFSEAQDGLTCAWSCTQPPTESPELLLNWNSIRIATASKRVIPDEHTQDWDTADELKLCEKNRSVNIVTRSTSSLASKLFLPTLSGWQIEIKK